MTEVDRLRDKYTKVLDNDCWEWQGALTKGYGQLTYHYTHWIAHRLFYMLFYGSIDSKKELHHKCEYKRCVNPEHMQQVDPKSHPDKAYCKGTVAGYRKHRLNNKCARGHEMTMENSYEYQGKITCLACRNIINAFRNL